MAAPTTDPTILAYMRALGFEEAEAERATAGGKEQAQQQYAMDKPRIQSQGIEQREQVAGGFEGRGLLKSGAYGIANARALGDEQYRLSQAQLGVTQTVSGLESQLAQQIAAMRRQQAERLLSSQQGQYLETESQRWT